MGGERLPEARIPQRNRLPLSRSFDGVEGQWRLCWLQLLHIRGPLSLSRGVLGVLRVLNPLNRRESRSSCCSGILNHRLVAWFDGRPRPLRNRINHSVTAKVALGRGNLVDTHRVSTHRSGGRRRRSGHSRRLRSVVLMRRVCGHCARGLRSPPLGWFGDLVDINGSCFDWDHQPILGASSHPRVLQNPAVDLLDRGEPLNRFFDVF